MTSADDRTVDYLNLIRHRLALVERIEDHVPQPRDSPTPELAINARPLAEFHRKVAPLRSGAGDPENTFQNTPAI